MYGEVVVLISVSALLLGSPGPAPLALAATGATIGIKRGLPFLGGILIGLLGASIGAASAIALIIEINPLVEQLVQVCGSAYILFLAYKIASAPLLHQESGVTNSDPSFIDGFFLNLLNPKAYAAFFALFSQFTVSAPTLIHSLVYTGFVSLSVAIVVDVVWLVLGGAIGSLFTQPRSARLLRVFFAILMVMAVFWALFY